MFTEVYQNTPICGIYFYASIKYYNTQLFYQSVCIFYNMSREPGGLVLQFSSAKAIWYTEDRPGFSIPYLFSYRFLSFLKRYTFYSFIKNFLNRHIEYLS